MYAKTHVMHSPVSAHRPVKYGPPPKTHTEKDAAAATVTVVVEYSQYELKCDYAWQTVIYD